MGKKHNVVYLLSGAFWTLGPGAACRGPACFRHLRLRAGDSAPDLGLPVIPPPVGSGSGGLGGGRRGGDAAGKVFFVCFLQSLSAETRILAVVALPPGAPPKSSSGCALGASGRMLLGSPPCLSHLPKWRVLGRSLHLCEPEWLPPTSPQIFTEHRPRHQKWPVQVPAPVDTQLCLGMWGENISLGAWLVRLIRVASKGPGGGSDQRTRRRDGRGPHPRLRLGLQGTRWGAGGGVGSRAPGESPTSREPSCAEVRGHHQDPVVWLSRKTSLPRSQAPLIAWSL
uniref:Uncharacterized protein n=1 Tax=Myotis myotis TaxID=51298 RepID=A0A7J7T5S8_MYOMY|nr:hypothetical protein mMyoMyo1_009126 [Myotis myotis]